MLDVFEMIDGYCLLLVERVNLIEQEKVCPDELKEAASSLLYASTRCGEFPELQEIRAVLTARFGKEFAARAIELRNNCGVNPKMIQKLSTRQSGLESRLKMLKEIALENGIVLQIEEASSTPKEEKVGLGQKQNQPKPEESMNSGGNKVDDDFPKLTKEMQEVASFSELMKGRKKYRDAADAAQAAFESAAYAAAAARAAVELSRSESFDPDDQDRPNSQPKNLYSAQDPLRSELHTVDKEPREVKELHVGLGFEKIHPKNDDFESDNEAINIGNEAEGPKQNKNAARVIRSVSSSSSDSDGSVMEGTKLPSDVEGQLKTLEKEMIFDESDNENGYEPHEIKFPRNHAFSFDPNGGSFVNEVSTSGKSNTVKDEDMFGARGARIPYPSQKPISVRTRRVFGR